MRFSVGRWRRGLNILIASDDPAAQWGARGDASASYVKGVVFEFDRECAAIATAASQLVEQPATHQYSE